jgi:hypothetical protein
MENSHIEEPTRPLQFSDKDTRKRLRASSLFDLVVYMWLDRNGNQGTKLYLSRWGLSAPSDGELVYFRRKIRNAVFWRLGVTVVLGAVLLLFLWTEKIPPF